MEEDQDKINVLSGEWLLMSYEDRLELILHEPQKIGLSANVVFLAEYLAGYRPGDENRHIDNESSVDIQETLSGVYEYSINDISAVMYVLGYRPIFAGGVPVWNMVTKENLT